MSRNSHAPTIGAEEEKLGRIVKIDDLPFDAGCSTRNEEIDHGLQKLFRYRPTMPRPELTSTYFSKQTLGSALSLIHDKCKARKNYNVYARRQNCPLCATFRNIFVFQRLSRGQGVVLVEPSILLPPAHNKPNAKDTTHSNRWLIE